MSDAIVPIDITPDKSLIQKLGLTGYRTEQAIAELVDNSIDARIEGQLEIISINIDLTNERITVADDGRGMSKNDLANALTIAKGTKPEGKLGKFGIGMKSACSTLGKRFKITTSATSSDVEYIIEYDEKKWLSDKSLDWKNFGVRERKKNHDWHGTTIEIDELKVPIYKNQVTNFKKSFGIRYEPYLSQKQVAIKINSDFCKPVSPILVEGTKRDVTIELDDGKKIQGWIGWLKRGSIKGEYGIHLFKNGRLIQTFEKFGIRVHPTMARFVGRLDLDHVPVNYHKSSFLKDSFEYQKAEKAFREEPIVKELIRNKPKEAKASDSLTSVVQYVEGKTSTVALDSFRQKEVREILDSMPTDVSFKDNKKPICMRFVDEKKSPLYSTNKVNNELEIIINRKNAAFDYVRDPNFLIALIMIEAKLLGNLNNPAIEKFVEERNDELLSLLSEPSIRAGYGIVSTLSSLFDALSKSYENKFQFTALSTLQPFVNNLQGKIVYTILTEPGSGQFLKDKLDELMTKLEGNEFTVLVEPKGRILQNAIDIAKGAIIAIRETTEFYSSGYTKPEKAWVDLFREVVDYGLPVADDELYYILENLLHQNLVDFNEIRKIAKRLKTPDKIKSIEDILSTISIQ